MRERTDMEVSSETRGVNDQRGAMAVVTYKTAQEGLPYSLKSVQVVQIKQADYSYMFKGSSLVP